MKKMLLMTLLILIAVYGSGCATILGGIIGYQSGEAVAGAAIGAAIDITSAISSHAQQNKSRKEQKERDKELEQKHKEAIKIYDEEGYIRVGSIVAENKNIADRLQQRFDDLNWKYIEITDKPDRKDQISRRVFQIKLVDQKEFTLELFSEKNRDLLIFIKPAEPDREFQSMLTSQIGLWMQKISEQ